MNGTGNGICHKLPDLLNPAPPVADVKASGIAQINRASTLRALVGWSRARPPSAGAAVTP